MFFVLLVCFCWCLVIWIWGDYRYRSLVSEFVFGWVGMPAAVGGLSSEISQEGRSVWAVPWDPQGGREEEAGNLLQF